MTGGNINSPSLPPIQGGNVTFINKGDANASPVVMRAYQQLTVSGSAVFYLTTDGTPSGAPLFIQKYFLAATPMNSPGLALSVYVVEVSNTEIEIQIYDNSGLYIGSIDVQLLVIGESAV